jgi:hypothetical protein
VLVGSARPLVAGAIEPATAQGAGLVDPAAAARAVLAVEPATVSFGRVSGTGRLAERTISVRNLSSQPLVVGLGVATDPGAGVLVSFAADPAQATIAPGAEASFRLVVAAATAAPPETVSGALVIQAAGAEPVRVPWAIAFPQTAAELLSGVALTPAAFVPSGKRPAVLAFRAGFVSEEAGGVAIDPVGAVDIELSTRKGRVLGVIARLRDLLPGRYAIGLTGRGPDGAVLKPGRYVLTVRAYAADAAEGAPAAATARLPFRILPRGGAT